MSKIQKKIARGFTLIEILIVIGIIAILAAIVLVAINPTRQFRVANDTQRTSNVNAILNAIGQYTIDNKGSLPGNISSTEKNIGSDTGNANICSDLVPKYIVQLPTDPKSSHKGASVECTDADDIGYTVEKDTEGRVTVAAPLTEEATTDISVTR